LTDYDWVRDLTVPMQLGLKPLCHISIHGGPVALLKFQMVPKLILLISSGSKKEPRYAYLSEAKTKNVGRSFFLCSTPPKQWTNSPSRWRCLLRVLCPLRRPVTALD